MKVKGASGSVKEVTTNPSKKLGRPFNPNSKGYIRRKILENRKKAQEGYVPLGRPIIADSKHHQMVEALRKKRAAGLVVKPGRPIMTEEEKEASRKYHTYMRKLLGLNVVKKVKA